MQIASQVLMIRPANFGFNTETAANNAFQTAPDSLTAREIQHTAITEFDNFITILRKHKINVLVHQDPANPPKPDAIFPNNWFATFPDGTLIIFPMFAPNRRIEKLSGLTDLIKEKFIVKNCLDWSHYENEGRFLESTGSMIFDHNARIIYACLSVRTGKSLLEKFSTSFGYKFITFTATDENAMEVYHTNVIMNIGEGYAVICLESIRNESERCTVMESLHFTGHEIIPISLEQVRAFAGNMLQVKNGDGVRYTILSQSAFDVLTDGQKVIFSRYTVLLPIKIDVIEGVGGGSVPCMMAEIFLEERR